MVRDLLGLRKAARSVRPGAPRCQHDVPTTRASCAWLALRAQSQANQDTAETLLGHARAGHSVWARPPQNDELYCGYAYPKGTADVGFQTTSTLVAKPDGFCMPKEVNSDSGTPPTSPVGAQLDTPPKRSLRLLVAEMPTNQSGEEVSQGILASEDQEIVKFL